MLNRTRLIASILSMAIVTGSPAMTALTAETEPAPAAETVSEVTEDNENPDASGTEDSDTANTAGTSASETPVNKDNEGNSAQPDEDHKGADDAAVNEGSTSSDAAPAEEQDEITAEDDAKAETAEAAGTEEDAAEPQDESEEKEADPKPKKKSEIDMTGAVYAEGEVSKVTVEGKSGDERFEEYVDSLFYGSGDTGKKKARSHSGYRLTGQNRAIYDKGAEMAADIVNGEDDNSEFNVYMDDMGLDVDAVYTAADLGVSRLMDRNGEIAPEVYDAMKELFDYDGSKVIECLFADHPFNMYWAKYELWYQIYPDFATNGTYLWFTSSDVWFGIPVENQFRAVKNTNNSDDFYNVDTGRITSAANAANNAAGIIRNRPSGSDADTLIYYKNKIRQLSNYNHTAADTDGYGDVDRGPWALVYVFDNDPTTNVVCEGYTRAFQYLCDRTQFNDDSVCAYSVGGYMWDSDTSEEGRHAWNIVHMDDGRNYIADVTNAEDDGSLFLCGMEPHIYDPYVYFTRGNDFYYGYRYDDITREVFTLNELTLSCYDYGEEGCYHEYGGWTTVQKRTCELDGVREKRCIYCGDVVSEFIPAAHTWNTGYTVDSKPTLIKVGIKSIHCKYCNAVKDAQRIPKLINVAKGSVTQVKAKTYTGKSIGQTPKVVVNKYRLLLNKDYKITYKNNKSVGTATMIITGIGRYGGQIKKTFVINPKGTALVSLTPASRKITVKWKKQAVQTTGYQIQYSTDKTFKKGVKSVTKKGTSTVSAVVSGLTSKKTYYVRIRTYKTVSGKTYYSAWSTVKKTIVK